MNNNTVGLQHASHLQNIHQIFEVNVINNLECECIFVQIKSDLDYQQTIVNTIATPHQQTLNGYTSVPVNSRFLNQQRSFINNYHPNANTIPPIPINKVPNEAKIIKPVMKELGGVNNDVYPGFVRVAPFQSLAIPVVINNKFQNGHIAFMTIYVKDSVNNKVICLANQLQINRENIEIKRAENGNIVIKAICYTENQIDNLLYSWSIPQYLINSMKNNGWENISLWHEITDADLIEMGFQRGHRLIFFDKFTDLLRNQNKDGLVVLYIKDILKSWNLPIYLFYNMVENGWVDPCDWAEITDHHFKKMNFQDGHVVKFRKQIKHNNHLIAFQKMQSEFKEKMKPELNDLNTAISINSGINSDINSVNGTRESLLKNHVATTSNIPMAIFKIEPNTTTHEQFWYKLNEMKPNETYYVETKHGNNAWQEREEIIDTKRRNICELDMNTTYFVRIRSENKDNNKKINSRIVQVKTQDEKWKNIHLPKIPDFKYAVSSNNKQITVEFEPKSLVIKQTKFDERYSLGIGLSKDELDDGLERIVNWKNVATLRKDKLIYKYNVNDQKDADWVHVGISARNDLGQRYNQCTGTRQFPFNQVIKRINTTKHGNNLQFDESKTVATKIDQDNQYSTFAFGTAVTREMCGRYDMYVKVNKLKFDYFMGFAPSLESVIDWNQALGYGGNKNSSVGVLANKLSGDFAVYNKDKDKRYMYHNKLSADGINKKKWDDGSVFVLSFDFLNDDCNIYLNENNDVGNNDHNTLDKNTLLKSIKLNQIKSVVPSFSLNSQGDSIQVVKWRMY